MEELVGMKLRHKNFGECVAISCQGDYLAVQLHGGTATFIVPDAFYGGLSAKDPEDWAVIAEAIGNWKRAASPEQLERLKNYCAKKEAERKEEEELRLKREEERSVKRLKDEEAVRSQGSVKIILTSDFLGGAFSNFFRNLLVAFVTFITLGIAYPFMLCWKERWIASNTSIDGHVLAFDGTGIQLIGKYLLWLFLSVVTLGVYGLLCMPLNMERWEAKHTHFAGKMGESKFNGHIWQLFGVRMLSRFLSLITLGLASFWAHCYKERWYAKHTFYDGVQLRFDGKGWQYFGKRIIWLLLTVVTLGIYAFWLTVKTKKWTVSHIHTVCEETVPAMPQENA